MEFSALPAFTFEIQSIHFLFSPLCIGVLSNDDKIACQKILEKNGSGELPGDTWKCNYDHTTADFLMSFHLSLEPNIVI